MNVIKSQLRYESIRYVFVGRGDSHINGWSKAKREFDAKLDDVEPWTIRDLRRTARSLMSRSIMNAGDFFHLDRRELQAFDHAGCVHARLNTLRWRVPILWIGLIDQIRIVPRVSREP